MMGGNEVLVVAGLCLLFLVLTMLRQTEKAIQERTAEARITNDLTRRQAELEAFRRLQAVREEHAARGHGHHGHGHGHASGNASMPGGCG